MSDSGVFMKVINGIRKFWSSQPVRFFVIYIALGVIVASLCILLARTVLFRNLELLTLDMLFQFRGPRVTASTESIVIVEITSEDLQKFGHWPWPRSRIAGLVEDLKRLGARGVLLDFLASEPTNSFDDDALAKAIENAGNVYLPFGYPTSDATFTKLFLPIEKFRRHRKGMGAVNVFTDSDGKIRRIPLLYFDGSQLQNNIVLQIVKDHFGMEINQITPQYLLLANHRQKIAVPLVGENMMLLNWHGKARDTFKHYSFLDIFNAARATEAGAVSGVDASRIKNSFCIVAVTALGLYDTRANSMESECPGSIFLATALANIFDQDFLRIMPLWVNIFVIYLFAMIPAFYASAQRFSRVILMVVFVLGALAVMYFLFINNIIINFSIPIIAFTGSYIAVSAYHSAKSNIERRHLMALATTDGLSGLFNIRYFNEILKNVCWQAEKDPGQDFYLILCDIDSFKQLNDNFGHQAGDYVIRQVSQTIKNLVRSGDVIARYGGDEIIILLRGDGGFNAGAVVEKIRASIENLNLKWEGRQLPVAMSFGMTRFNPREDTPAIIIKRTDSALLSAKVQGKNRVVSN